jgi:thymidylate kinase
MNKKARYFVFEGVEGVGKTTQVDLLVKHLTNKGFSVLKTKEPGSEHSPLTMTLRKIMLDSQFDTELTIPAREFISQAIRSIHLEKVITPSLYKYDYIIQDRGILSGYAYAKSCGNSFDDIYNMTCQNIDFANISASTSLFHYKPENIYDRVIYLKGNPTKSLAKAINSKNEFSSGDAIEAKGESFILNVSGNMDMYSKRFNTEIINVDNKNIDEVFLEILSKLDLE